MDPPVFPNFVSNSRGLLFEGIMAQERNNVGDLGQRRLDFIPLLKIYRFVVNMKLE
jgi:hypothetical protein